MSYEIYKLIHLLGLFLLISGLMGVYYTVKSGVAFQGNIKKFSFALHGLGLLLILVSGFGLLARLGMAANMPSWVYIKLTIWIFFAIIISVLKRKSHIGWPLFVLLMAGYLIAAYTAIYKP